MRQRRRCSRSIFNRWRTQINPAGLACRSAARVARLCSVLEKISGPGGNEADAHTQLSMAASRLTAASFSAAAPLSTSTPLSMASPRLAPTRSQSAQKVCASCVVKQTAREALISAPASRSPNSPLAILEFFFARLQLCACLYGDTLWRSPQSFPAWGRSFQLKCKSDLLTRPTRFLPTHKHLTSSPSGRDENT